MEMTFGELASCPVPGGHIYYKGFLAEAGIAYWRFLVCARNEESPIVMLCYTI